MVFAPLVVFGSVGRKRPTAMTKQGALHSEIRIIINAEAARFPSRRFKPINQSFKPIIYL